MFKHCIGISKDKSMFALVQICGVLSSRGTCYPHVRCISIYTCRKYIYHIGHSNRIISVIIVIEMVKDGRLKWTDCRPSLALSKWYCKNRAKYTCIRFARLTMLQIFAKAGQLLDPSFLCPYDQCSRYMQYNILINSESLLKELLSYTNAIAMYKLIHVHPNLKYFLLSNVLGAIS